MPMQIAAPPAARKRRTAPPAARPPVYGDARSRVSCVSIERPGTGHGGALETYLVSMEDYRRTSASPPRNPTAEIMTDATASWSHEATRREVVTPELAATCLDCDAQFGPDTGIPAAFSVTLPFADRQQAIVSGICETCAAKGEDHLQAVVLRWLRVDLAKRYSIGKAGTSLGEARHEQTTERLPNFHRRIWSVLSRRSGSRSMPGNSTPAAVSLQGPRSATWRAVVTNSRRGRQWAVTKFGIECRDGSYAIAGDRYEEDEPNYSWVQHMAGKDWVDIEDFAEAMRVARRMKRSPP